MRPGRARRGGWTLLELLVVLTAVTVLLTLAAGLVFQMLRVDAGERSRVVASANLERLGRDLRGDAHDATGTPEVGPDRLAFALADGRRAEYSLGGRDVRRTVRRGDKVEHRESYRLPTALAGRFESSREGPRTLVAFVMTPERANPPSRPADPGYRDFRIEAIAGRDLTGGAR